MSFFDLGYHDLTTTVLSLWGRGLREKAIAKATGQPVKKIREILANNPRKKPK